VQSGMMPACESSEMVSGFSLCNGFEIMKISGKQCQKKSKEYIEIHAEIERARTVRIHQEQSRYLEN
jgi:hypothetical protein